MPNASNDLRELMGLMFGDNISDGPPMQYLLDRGWKLNRKWEWVKPTYNHFVGEKEELCIRFLMDEWDFGGIAESSL